MLPTARLGSVLPGNEAALELPSLEEIGLGPGSTGLLCPPPGGSKPSCIPPELDPPEHIAGDPLFELPPLLPLLPF